MESSPNPELELRPLVRAVDIAEACDGTCSYGKSTKLFISAIAISWERIYPHHHQGLREGP